MQRSGMTGVGSGRRKRTRISEPLKKASYQMRESVLDGIRKAVEEGAAPSANAFVEEAIVERLRELRRMRLYAEYAEAAADPEFIREMREVARDFDATVGDGLAAPEE